MGRSILARAEAERILKEKPFLQGKRYSRHADALKRLPADVDAELAARAAIRSIQRTSVGQYGQVKHLPAPVIRIVLEILSEGVHDAEALFLREAVETDRDDAALKAAWNESLATLFELQSCFVWGSKLRRGRLLLAVSRNPRLLSAVQSAVVGSTKVPANMLAVLAADGSDASADALLPIFVRAQREGGPLVQELEQLKKHAAKTPAMNQMLASIRAGRDARHAASPALSLARSIGLELTKLKIRVPLQSSKYEGELQIDSKERMWLYVGVSDGSRATNFSNFGVFADTLKLDACEAGELPAWLARAQKKLKTRWNRNVKAAGVIRKKDGQRLVDWLFSALPE